MKTVLAFETSSPLLSVALGTPSGRVREAAAREELQHSENFIPLVERLLKKERLTLEKIEAFAIDRGPGSYTGLRIGFSLLKGFLAVEKKPCYGAMSLDLMAEQASVLRREGSRLAVLLDARLERIYVRFYHCRGGEWIPEGNLELLSREEAGARLGRGPAIVIGSVKKKKGRGCFLSKSSLVPFYPLSPFYPSAATLVKWFQTENSRLSLLKKPEDFLPLYLRLSEAEEGKGKEEKKELREQNFVRSGLD